MFRCNLPYAHLAEWPGSFTRYRSNTGWNGLWIRVSTQSSLWRRKFSCHSCWDSNSQPFDHESCAVTNKLSWLPIVTTRVEWNIHWDGQGLDVCLFLLFYCDGQLPGDVHATPVLKRSVIWSFHLESKTNRSVGLSAQCSVTTDSRLSQLYSWLWTILKNSHGMKSPPLLKSKVRLGCRSMLQSTKWLSNYDGWWEHVIHMCTSTTICFSDSKHNNKGKQNTLSYMSFAGWKKKKKGVIDWDLVRWRGTVQSGDQCRF